MTMIPPDARGVKAEAPLGNLPPRGEGALPGDLFPEGDLPQGGELPLPDECAVRLINLGYGVGAMISVDEDGFANIFLNARLSREAQRKALQHELRHFYRGDMFSDADIKAIERPAARREDTADELRAMDGTPVRDDAGVFDVGALRRVGRGIYRPEGANLEKAADDIAALKGVLIEACGVYDVMQRPPLTPASALRSAISGLDAADIAFIGWRPGVDAGDDLPVVMQINREREGVRVYGALYYARGGRPDNALVVCECGAVRITFDLRRRRDALDLHAIFREIGDREARVY